MSLEAIANTNRAFLNTQMMRLLPAAFPHLQAAQIETFVRGLFDLNQDLTQFKEHLRDFLVALREFSAQDAADLWAEERELEAERKAKAERDAALLIPGLVKPVDREDDMSD
jgi:exportin-1